MSLSNDIKALRVQHSIPFLLREPLSRVLDALETAKEREARLTEALNKIGMLGMSGIAYSRDFTERVNEIARAALEEK